MSQPRILDDAKKLVVEIDVGIRTLPIHNTPRSGQCAAAAHASSGGLRPPSPWLWPGSGRHCEAVMRGE